MWSLVIRFYWHFRDKYPDAETVKAFLFAILCLRPRKRKDAWLTVRWDISSLVALIQFLDNCGGSPVEVEDFLDHDDRIHILEVINWMKHDIRNGSVSETRLHGERLSGPQRAHVPALSSQMPDYSSLPYNPIDSYPDMACMLVQMLGSPDSDGAPIPVSCFVYWTNLYTVLLFIQYGWFALNFESISRRIEFDWSVMEGDELTLSSLNIWAAPLVAQVFRKTKNFTISGKVGLVETELRAKEHVRWIQPYPTFFDIDDPELEEEDTEDDEAFSDGEDYIVVGETAGGVETSDEVAIGWRQPLRELTAVETNRRSVMC